jgi:hypothetical protein
MNAILARARALLQGEPVRLIGYGAIVVVWLVTHLALALGYGSAAPGLDDIVNLVEAAITLLIGLITEISRLFVSPVSPSA